MASNKSDEGVGLALIAAGIVIVGIVLFFAVAAFTAGLSLLCLWAVIFGRFKFGKVDIERTEAGWFIARGLVAAWLLPMLCLALFPIFLNQGVRGDWLPYLATGGYVLGSLGGEWLIDAMKGEDETRAAPPPAPEILPPEPPRKSAPFEFASWDDEDERH